MFVVRSGRWTSSPATSCSRVLPQRFTGDLMTSRVACSHTGWAWVAATNSVAGVGGLRRREQRRSGSARRARRRARRARVPPTTLAPAAGCIAVGDGTSASMPSPAPSMSAASLCGAGGSTTVTWQPWPRRSAATSAAWRRPGSSRSATTITVAPASTAPASGTVDHLPAPCGLQVATTPARSSASTSFSPSAM